MSNKHQPPDPENPFLALDRSQFARTRPAPGARKQPVIRRKTLQSAAPSETQTEAEAAWFSQQMHLGGVKKMPPSARADRRENTAGAGLSAGEPARPDPEQAAALARGAAPEPEGPELYFSQPDSAPAAPWLPEEFLPGQDKALDTEPGKGALPDAGAGANRRRPAHQPVRSGQTDFGSLAEHLSGIKIEPPPPAQTEPDSGQAREQEDRMLREYLAASPVRGPARAARNAPAAQPDPLAEPGLNSGESDDDAFALAMCEVAPLGGKGRMVAPEPAPAAQAIAPGNPLQDFMDGKVEFSLEYTDEFISGHVLGLDPAVMGKLKAGSFSYEGHLDLHGLNSLQAFESLVAFIKRSYMTGKRTVLVIPGRGKNSPDGTGVLRDKLQEWLTQEPFKRVVLAFATALPKHGGPGAVYVLLRKLKKSRGKIRWEALPKDPDLFV